MNHEPLLARGLAALDFDISSGILDKLIQYLDEIERWNPLYGLVSAEGEDLVIKHVLDSLSPWRVLAELLASLDSSIARNGMATVIDIGTGAGFPGIPLAIAFPERPFVLIERLEKRVRFLESAITLLGLSNVEIRQGTAENEQEAFQCVVFRALRPFGDKKLFRSIWKKIQPGGALFAYKGRLMHARLELAELSEDAVLGNLAARAQIVSVWVPFLEEERCVVIARKA
ncbi:Ribosomal RNA small subunit methyltransferase G [uncultured spirochete]|jgi:16S rRNA (guanine527-N7)-methyltransferase|uniref:Ribosomal RNA small subunit methyltransferase G n=1 Tax=uncultured spirochete TaxID=156406 RepID=A0A3P3XJH7_9SPIR|nr:16S rRNA (guanine(527)-N(7))-methyltransferase RsmG [Rectinema subterraneum]SLM13046.1 Ribosomal RNA small subunit methyltransferase G [uncultured spirochete]HBE46524.1 16S rRNA (guanine(527)-N(7))-methyltransferase RsmG [Spirochaetaceae bacterium]